MSTVETSRNFKIPFSTETFNDSWLSKIYPRSNTLKDLGITTAEGIRLRHLTLEEGKTELQRNLEAYTNEVLADKPVSILCHYYPDFNGNLFSDPSLKPLFDMRVQFDPQERGNLPFEGFKKVQEAVLQNPHKVVLWYSPPGPAAFDHNPSNPYSAITYDYGQLYIQFFDGKEVRSVALKIFNEGVLEQFSPELSLMVATEDKRQRIETFLTHPVLLDKSLEELLNLPRKNNITYIDKKGKFHYLADVLYQMEQTFGGYKAAMIQPYDLSILALSQFEVTERMVEQAYTQTVERYMKLTRQKQMSLSGSCGGSTVSLDGFGLSKEIYESPGEKMLSVYSSSYRLLTQREETWDYHTGDCVIPKPKCGRTHVDVGPCGLCKLCEKRPEYN